MHFGRDDSFVVLQPTSLEIGTDDLPDPPEALAFEAVRRQYLKEQFISGQDEVPELDELPEPAAPDQHGLDIEP